MNFPEGPDAAMGAKVVSISRALGRRRRSEDTTPGRARAKLLALEEAKLPTAHRIEPAEVKNLTVRRRKRMVKPDPS